MNKLIDIREKFDLTQEEIAKKLKTSQSNYSRWEKGTEFIPLNKLNYLCNCFNTSIDYLFGFVKTNKKTNNIELNKKEIGNNIKILRKENNLTQKDLANFLNTTQSTISAYESGKTLILTAFAYQLAKKYNISMDWLCGKSNKKYIK